jgi:hypothetical protein
MIHFLCFCHSDDSCSLTPLILLETRSFAVVLVFLLDAYLVISHTYVLLLLLLLLLLIAFFSSCYVTLRVFPFFRVYSYDPHHHIRHYVPLAILSIL